MYQIDPKQETGTAFFLVAPYSDWALVRSDAPDLKVFLTER